MATIRGGAAGVVMAGALALFTSAVGCATTAPAPVVAKSAPHGHAHGHDPSDHNHARGKMLMASDGKTTALLTAHLSSKSGNELDVFVERGGSPFALPTTTLRAKAKAESGDEKTIDFECAPRDERPAAEPDDVCSHFVARTPWMTTGIPLRVEAALPVSDRTAATPFVWRDFEARRYAHHEE